MLSPLPRFRIYSRAQDYGRVFLETSTGQTLKGDDCRSLEQNIANYIKSPHALCTAKARVAIFLAIEALLEGRPKNVIMSPYTISDVVNMVICAGGTPIFADLEPQTCNISADELERLIDADTGLVLVTHLHGLACDVVRISELCRSHGVPLVEDAAQALGTQINGQHVGTFGVAGIFSFGMYKSLNSFFGGMLVTRDALLDKKIRARSLNFPPQELGYLLRKVLSGFITDAATFPPLFSTITFPIFRYALIHEVGLLNQQVSVDTAPTAKSILPETYLRCMRPLQARLALAKLGRLDNDIRARIERAMVYFEGFSDLPQITLPPFQADGSHAYSYFSIRVPDRDALVKYLMRNGRDVAKQHLKNAADLKCFAPYFRNCPNARATADEVVLMPTYPRYSIDEVKKNIAVVREFYATDGS